ncbi:MAG: toxin-antitoxin system HicB family antitoxin [Verrucomicrobia bacterium]|nr:toxin-antitoxin system HicB family antitoxin [Verrucomicrobiota bacterium]
MTKTFPIELSEELHKRVKIAAIQEGLTLHDWIVKTLEEKVGDDGNYRATPARTESNHERSNRTR